MTRNTYDNDNTSKKVFGYAIAAVAVLAVGAAGLYLVDVDQTKEARLPDVDVTVAEGQMPKFDVDVADVDIRSEEVGVTVPTMGVRTETRTIEVEVPVDVDVDTDTVAVSVPTLEIEKPEEDNPADNN